MNNINEATKIALRDWYCSPNSSKRTHKSFIESFLKRKERVVSSNYILMLKGNKTATERLGQDTTSLIDIYENYSEVRKYVLELFSKYGN